MGKIKKVATDRHTATLSPYVRDFVQKAAEVPLHELPAQLRTFPHHWPLPRGDLYHWIPLLDRFDHILELFNREYGLHEGPQTQPFDQRLLKKGDAEDGSPYPKAGASPSDIEKAGYSVEGDRELVEAVLQFTRVLHEHCGNRSLYASSTHINDLLHTTSPSLLRSCLLLGLRLAQRYQVARFKNPGSQAQLLASHYNISLDNLQKIAAPFTKPQQSDTTVEATPIKQKDKSTQMSAFNPNDLNTIVKGPLPPAARQAMSSVNLDFYERPTATPQTSTLTASAADAPPATPTPVRRTSNLGPSRDRPPPSSRSVSTNDVATPSRSREQGSLPSAPSRRIQLPFKKVEETPSWSLVKGSLSDTPADRRYEVLNRIRIAKAFASSGDDAQQVLEIRLLAIANLAYALSEARFQEKVGIPDAEEPRRYHLAQQLCDLLQPPTRGQEALNLQCETTVIMALEALTKVRQKVSQVAEGLAITANHGILYYELRKVIASLSIEPHADEMRELEESKWRDATFDLINGLLQSNTQSRLGEKMVSAGIMGILVEALSLRTARAEKFYERILQFFDSFIHGITTALQTLANVRGLDIIADLTAFQVNLALECARGTKRLPQHYKSKVVDYEIPFYQQSTLRQLFKNTAHMFEHNSTGHDRLLRNLIDTPQILNALRSVIENATMFGSNVWSGAISILSSFIHNEPTSYQVIGEAGLSKSFLESITGEKIPDTLPDPGTLVDTTITTPIEIDSTGAPTYPSAPGILPVGEVMCDIPNAFGAICLNENGMQLFQASGVLNKYFDIFLSPAHVRAMEEEGPAATTIGHSFDELSRHHPKLKEQIMDAVFSMLRRMKELTAIIAEHQEAGTKLWELKDDKLSIAGGRTALKSIPQSTYDKALFGKGDFLPTRDTETVYDTNVEDRHDRAPAVPYLSVCFKFLEGFFHNHTMCSMFCEASGAEMLLDLAMSPSNPYDVVAFPLFSKITQVLKTMCDAKPTLVLPSIIRRTQHAILALRTLIHTNSPSSSFLRYTNLSDSAAETPFPDGLDGTTVAKALLNTHLLTHVLGRTLAPPPYTLRHGNQNNHLFTNLNFTDVYVDLINDLSKLHAACLWETQILQRSMSEETKSSTEPRPFVMRRIGTNGIVELVSDRADATRVNGAAEHYASKAPSEGASRAALLCYKNTKSIRYLLSQVPMGIESFLHSLGQAIVTKRSEQNSKQHAIFVADQLAQAIIWELDFRRNDPNDTVMEIKYISQMLTMIGRMLLRNSYSMEAFGTKETLTLVMTKFYLHNGFSKLNEYLARFVRLLVQQEDSDKVEPSVKDAIQAILSFYGQIVRAKCINDASQSNVIIVRDRTQPDYFQPGQFLVEVRNAVLPAISAIWKSKDLEKFTDGNMHSVVEILRLILKSEGEDRALKRSERASRRVLAHKPKFALPKTDGVDKLMKCGFDRRLSREAMYRCGGSPQAAQVAESYCKLRQRDPRVPRFPIPEDEATEQSDATSQSATETEQMSQSIHMEDANSRANNSIEEARPVVPSDSNHASDDDNFGSLGRIPADMQEEDFASLADPASLELLRLNRPRLEAKDTQQPFTTVDDLDEKRDAVRADLIDCCLDVLSTQPGLAFELADLIQAAFAKSGDGANPRADIGTTLVSSLMSLQAEEPSAELGVKIRAYAHLVALVLQDRDFFDSTIDELKEYFDNLVGLVKIDQGAKLEDSPWIEMVLLIIERVLAEDEQPIEVEWEAPPVDDPLKPMPAVSEPESLVSSDTRSELFDALVGLLVKIGKNSSLALSVCRVLVVLTRKRELATRLADKTTLGSLFTMIRQLAGSVDEKLQASFMLLLRHLVEDDDTIRQIMRTEIRLAFDTHRSSRALDTTSYTRNMYHLAIRNPSVFVEVTQELLEITRFDGNTHRPQQLGLKKLNASQPQAKPGAGVKTYPENHSQEEQKNAEAKMPAVEITDGVIQFLLRQLSTYKDVEDSTSVGSKQASQSKVADAEASIDIEMPDATPGSHDAEVVARPVEAKNEKPTFKPEEHTIYIYRCFILQCLAELVACYNRTKLEFINFSRKSDAHPATPSKPRAGTLNYMLNVLLPIGTLEHCDDVSHRKKSVTANWATNVLVSLCTKTQERQIHTGTSLDPAEFAEQEPELTFVRKFVLEHALRAFKEATASGEPLDLRYSRLLALGELFNRMLSGKVDLQRSSMQAASNSSAQQQIGRFMYEKNFIGTLTSAIAEMDLNFPNAKRAVKYILAPLKQLTELGVTLSQTSDLCTGPSNSAEDDDISSATSVSEEDDEREQTPDLLRNTTLGDDDEDDSDVDDDDDEMGYEEDAYDDEMDYEEEIMAEHGDVVSDDDEDELGEMGEIEGVPGDVDMEIDVLTDDEDEGDSDDSDTDADEDQDEDEDEDEDPDEGDIEFGDDLGEVTGDNENASLGEHDVGDWEDDGIVFDEEDAMNEGGSPHGGPLDHMNHILRAANPSDPDDVGHIVHIDMGQGEEEFFDDEMPPEDDDDDQEGEIEYAEDIVYEPELEDEEDDDLEGGWAWEMQPPGILRGGHPHHHHHHHHHRGLNEMLGMIGDPLRPMGIRSHRSTPNAREEDGVNPLLQREGAGASRRDRDTLDLGSPRLGTGSRRTILPHRGDTFFQDIVAAVGPAANGPGIINVNLDPGAMPGLGGLPPVFTVQRRHGGPAMFEVDPSRPWREYIGGLPGAHRMGDFGRLHDRGHASNEEAQAVDFRPTQTVSRWQEEARMLFPGKFHEKALRVINLLLQALLPTAMEAKRIREKEEAERRAATEKEAEEARKRTEIENEEREAREKKEREEREARERAEAEVLAREQVEQAEAVPADADMQGVESTDVNISTERQSGDGEPEQPTERITINIRGRELDITSLGIDREYIEALPEEMREEVIMAQYHEQRSQAVQQGEQHSEISREFLDALPRDIQQELIRSEQLERRRREREEERQRRRAQGGEAQQPPQAEDMNTADFMAMLDQPLRQSILMDADDTVLAALPEDLQAEARALFGDRRPPGGGRLGRVLEAAGGHALRQEASGAGNEAAHEPSRQRRPVVQMLDKAGIATLLRLMFVSLNHKAKTHLHGILSDVCKNTQNRAEVISLLLSILQDGTADVSAVERSFAQLSLRAKQSGGLKTPQPTRRNASSQQGIAPGTDLSPLNIVQQCLGTLNALANDNPRVPSFFLNEHETISSQSTKANKKGKGRESRAARFPLNALLTLLDRKLITENTAVMETLASLLSHVTHPLTILLRRAKEAQESTETKGSEATEAPQVQPDRSDEQMQGVAPEALHDDAAASTSVSAQDAEPELKEKAGEGKRKHRGLTPPEVPEENIGLVVNILAARECPSKTFSDTLDIIKNLSAIPGSKQVFGKELIRQAQELGQTLLADLEELAKQINAAQTGTDVQGMALASFSSAGAKQKKLLRVLVALDHLFDPKRTPQTPAVIDPSVEQRLKDHILATLYESSTFERLWTNLSSCLTAIRQRGNMVNVATILLPLIESLMVVCRNSAHKEAATANLTSPADTDASTPPPDARMASLFYSFTEEHRKILNELIRNNSKLMNGNLAVLAENSKVLEFDNKRSYFTRKVHDRRSEARVSHPSLQLNVRRENVFLDSFKSLYYKSGDEIKYGKLNIRFVGEEGIDAGGVSREWFAAMARQMFNPDYALFNPVAADRTTFHPNSLSEVNPEHLLFFKFIGRIIGKALYENKILDCHFSRAVYRKILGKSVSLKDMETLDLDYYRSLVWILENDITDVTFETFSVDVDRFGVTETIDLIPNGRNIAVTEENKQEYVRHVVDYRLIKSVQSQLDHFLEGFHEIIPSELIAIFNEQELELLISGLPNIDVDDWKANTDYTNYTPNSPQIQWFWRAVKGFDKEEQAKLLQFVTGTSKVPLNGFKELEGMNGFSKFNIHRDYSSKEKLPSSHTCFNQLDLPEYESYDHLRNQLYTAITAGSEYFGFA